MSLIIISDCKIAEAKLLNILINYKNLHTIEMNIDTSTKKICNIETKYFTASIQLKHMDGNILGSLDERVFEGAESIVFCCASEIVSELFYKLCEILSDESDIQLKLFVHFKAFYFILVKIKNN